MWIGLDFEDREELYRRIDSRVDIMLEMGLIDEIKSLLARGIPAKCTAMQAIGYKEFIAALEGQMTTREAAAQVQQSSRRYAKRQLTWFRRNENMNWIKRKSGQSPDEIFTLARQLAKDNDN